MEVVHLETQSLAPGDLLQEAFPALLPGLVGGRPEVEEVGAVGEDEVGNNARLLK